MAESRPKKVFYALLGIAAGAALAIAILLVAGRHKSAPAPVPSRKLAGDVLREDAGSLDEVLLHYVPRLDSLVAPAYADFLGSLDGGAAASPTFREALATDRVTDAVLASAKSRQWQAVAG